MRLTSVYKYMQLCTLLPNMVHRLFSFGPDKSGHRAGKCSIHKMN